MGLAGCVNQRMRYSNIPAQYPTRTIEQFTFTHGFINCFRFFSSTCAPLGVVLRAWNTGSGGLGMNNLEDPNPIGNGAWALFEFTQANPKFWVHLVMQAAGFGGSVAGTPATPMAGEGSANASGIGGFFVSVAARSDGGNPWNGNFNSGSASKGTPVWTSGSSRLYVWPRSNNPGGSHNTNKENMTSGVTEYIENLFEMTNAQTSPSCLHYFAGPDWFTLLFDVAGFGSCYWLHFGKFIPRPELSGSYPQYFMASHRGRTANGHGDTEQMISEGYQWAMFGSLNGSGFDASTGGGFGVLPSYLVTDGVSMGGIACPLSSSTSPVRTMIFGTPNNISTNMSHMMGNLASSGSNFIDEWCPYLYIGENSYGTGSAGFVGHAKDLKFLTGPVPNMTINRQRTKIAINLLPAAYESNAESDYETPTRLSICLPWTGSVYPYHKASFDGTYFYVP